MTSNLKPMDVYSTDMTIPFDIASYCRGHKFSVQAVELSRAIVARETCKAEIAQAERMLATAETRVTIAINNARIKMDADKNA